MRRLKSAPPRQVLMTREEFTDWLQRRLIATVQPYDVVPCACRDCNCHGWRLVPRALARLTAPSRHGG